MKKRFSEAQIIGFLREAEAGLPVKDLCRRHGFSEASYYLWRSKFGGMNVSDAKRLKELGAENSRCFRHQLLLVRPYLVLTKPLRLDIQCQRAASVKIGWKYLGWKYLDD